MVEWWTQAEGEGCSHAWSWLRRCRHLAYTKRLATHSFPPHSLLISISIQQGIPQPTLYPNPTQLHGQTFINQIKSKKHPINCQTPSLLLQAPLVQGSPLQSIFIISRLLLTSSKGDQQEKRCQTLHGNQESTSNCRVSDFMSFVSAST